MTVRGGTPFVRYYVSANYVHEKGIYETFNNDDYDSNVYFKRYGMRTNLDFNVTKTTVFGVDLSGRLEERHDNDAEKGLYESMVRLPPNFLNYVNPNGTYGGRLNAVNPYAALSKYGYNLSKRNVFEAGVKLNQKLDFITKGLSARAMFGFVSNMASRRDVTERPELWEYIQYLPDQIANNQFYVPWMTSQYEKALAENYRRILKHGRTSNIKKLNHTKKS